MMVIGLPRLLRGIEEYNATHETPAVLSLLTLPQQWVVMWIAGGQTVEWTSSSSPWHFRFHIPVIVIKDWMRRSWFAPALEEAREIDEKWRGWRPAVIHFTPTPGNEPVPRTPKAMFWYELKKNWRLARRICGQEKRRKRLVETLGPNWGHITTEKAHQAVKMKHRMYPKPPYWRVGDPWKYSF